MPTTLGGRSILRSSDHVFAFVAEDFEGFVQDRSQLGKDRATTNATAFVMLDLRLWDAHLVSDLLKIPISHRGLVQSGRHPNTAMPMTGVAKMPPSCRSGISFKQRVWRQAVVAKRSCLARDAADFGL